MEMACNDQKDHEQMIKKIRAQEPISETYTRLIRRELTCSKHSSEPL